MINRVKGKMRLMAVLSSALVLGLGISLGISSQSAHAATGFYSQLVDCTGFKSQGTYQCTATTDGQVYRLRYEPFEGGLNSLINVDTGEVSHHGCLFIIGSDDYQAVQCAR